VVGTSDSLERIHDDWNRVLTVVAGRVPQVHCFHEIDRIKGEARNGRLGRGADVSFLDGRVGNRTLSRHLDWPQMDLPLSGWTRRRANMVTKERPKPYRHMRQKLLVMVPGATSSSSFGDKKVASVTRPSRGY
jgi:hypothetical protein